MSRYFILSFDGGGMRGLFTARLLRRLVRAVPQLVDVADLLAGTSTGGLVALGLAAGKSPEDLELLYARHGRDIFRDTLWDDVKDLGGAVGAEYGLAGLQGVLQREFGDRTLESLYKRVLIPSFDLDSPGHELSAAELKAGRRRRWKAKFFHNFPGEDSDGGELVRDVGVRTAAAPAFFPAYQGYVDGGVVANNPSMSAVAQALDPRFGGKALQDVVVLSLGTGAVPRHVAGSPDWGFAQWAMPLVHLLIEGTMDVARYQCEQLLTPARFRRVDCWLPRSVDLDATDAKSLRVLLDAAEAVDLGETVAWLEDVWTRGAPRRRRARGA